jgi:hypothetical protein
MALFGRRQVDAQVTGLAWSRVLQMERQIWEQKRSTPPAPDVTRRSANALNVGARTHSQSRQAAAARAVRTRPGSLIAGRGGH